jgi:hypothetical protein
MSDDDKDSWTGSGGLWRAVDWRSTPLVFGEEGGGSPDVSPRGSGYGSDRADVRDDGRGSDITGIEDGAGSVCSDIARIPGVGLGSEDGEGDAEHDAGRSGMKIEKGKQVMALRSKTPTRHDQELMRVPVEQSDERESGELVVRAC